MSSNKEEVAMEEQEKNSTIVSRNSDNAEPGQSAEETAKQIWSDIINFRSHFNMTDCITALFFGLGHI